MSPSRNNTSYLHQFFCSLIRSPTRLDWCTAKIPDPKMARKKHPGVVLHKLALGPGGKLWANIAWMLLLANGDTNFEGLQRPNARMNMQIWNTKCTYQLIISHDIQNHIHNFHLPRVIYHNHIYNVSILIRPSGYTYTRPAIQRLQPADVFNNLSTNPIRSIFNQQCLSWWWVKHLMKNARMFLKQISLENRWGSFGWFRFLKWCISKDFGTHHNAFLGHLSTESHLGLGVSCFPAIRSVPFWSGDVQDCREITHATWRHMTWIHMM